MTAVETAVCLKLSFPLMTMPETGANQAVPPAPAPAYSRRRIAKNFLGLTGINIVAKLVGLFTNVYSRRILGPEIIGMIGWNSAALSYLSLLTNPGMQTIAKRDVARDATKSTELLSLRLTAQLITAVPAFILALLIAWSGLRGPQVSWLLALQSISLLVGVANISWLLEAHERMIVPAAALLVAQVLQIPLLIWLVRSPADASIFVLYTIPFNLVCYAYVIWHAGRHGMLELSHLRPSLNGFWPLMRESWPLTLSGAAILLYYNCDAIILGFMKNGDELVGWYTTAYGLMLLITGVLNGSLVAAYFPALSRGGHDAEAFSKITIEFRHALLCMNLPISAVALVGGSLAITLIYGPSFAPAGPYFSWLCVVASIIAINTGLHYPMIAAGHQKPFSRIVMIGAAVNLFVNLVVIPIWGPWGAIATTWLAEAVVLVLTVAWWQRQQWPMQWEKEVRHILCWICIAAVLLLVKVYTGISPFILGVIGGLVACCYWAFIVRQQLRLRRTQAWQAGHS